jgi:ABC-type glutathione transport system ATPase component
VIAVNEDVAPHALEVEQLKVRIGSTRGVVEILHDVSFFARACRILGVVGESGSGKTMTTKAVFGVLPKDSVMEGSIRYRGRELDTPGAERHELLGRKLTMVFQDARSSLHPTFTIGRQLDWALRRARVTSHRAREDRARELLARVGLSGSREELRAYPFQFSGGMCQRVAIGIAIATDPDLIVADEPTSALDPTIQLQIADLFRDIIDQSQVTLLLVTHDIRLVQYLCDDVVVMRHGRVLESGQASQVLSDPQHEYTRFLIEATR